MLFSVRLSFQTARCVPIFPTTAPHGGTNQHLARLLGRLVRPRSAPVSVPSLMRLSMVSRSSGSVSMISLSRTGFTLPSTCVTFSSSKQRSALQNGIRFTNVGQELVAQPFALAGPFTSPAMSTISTVVGTIRSGVHQLGQFVQTVIGHRNHAHI